MTNVFDDEETAAADAADRERGRNDGVASVAHDQLKAFVERIERLEEEKKALADDIREIYAEAKGNGFSSKVLRKVIRRRKMDKAERDEADAMLELYEGVFG